MLAVQAAPAACHQQRQVQQQQQQQQLCYQSKAPRGSVALTYLLALNLCVYAARRLFVATNAVVIQASDYIGPNAWSGVLFSVSCCCPCLSCLLT
jgi:hypothetical protein